MSGLFCCNNPLCTCVKNRRVFSDASTTWLKYLGEKGIPVIVCLTFGDQLYFEIEERENKKSKGAVETAEDIRRIIGSELIVHEQIILLYCN